MLSIKNITSSSAAVAYFEKNDYYDGGGQGRDKSEGQWYGDGAEKMGLSGAVDRDVFKALLDGQLPDGTELGTVRERGGEKVHKPGWDLTFSAPKSVSVLGLVGGDERLRQAHDEAVKETLDWMEANIAGYRRRDFFGIKNERAANLTAALFQHATSREQEPQLHTHAVVLNAIQAEGGKWKSLDSEPFYKHKMAGGNIYRAALAARVQDLGYGIERRSLDGRFEIVSVPDAVIETFSTRAEQIKQAMKGRGLEGAEDAARMALATRGKKTNVPVEQLVPGWQAETQRQGLDAVAEVAAARGRPEQTPETPSPLDRAVKEAVARLSDTDTVFSNSELLRWTLAGSMGRARVADAEAAIRAAEARGELVKTVLPGTDGKTAKQRSGAATAWTTPAGQNIEKLFLESQQRGVGAVDAILPRAKAEAALQQTGKGLNAGQSAGALAILTTKNRFSGIEGRPGVGKTYMLGAVRTVLEQQGYVVKGMAANAEAARTLQQDAGIRSRTMQSHLRTASAELVKMQSSNPLTAAAMRKEWSKQVWVMDEASQVNARLMRRTMLMAEKMGARLVMIGDTRQLAAIEAGKPFEQLMANGMQRTEIDQNLRQKNEQHRQAVAKAVAGDVRGAMAVLSGDTVEIESREQRLQAIVQDWKKLGDGRDKTTVLTARNAERTALNDQMRDVLRSEGKLAGERATVHMQKVYAQRMDKVEAEIYKVGDLVRFSGNVRSLGIESGEYLRVESADRSTNELRLRPAEREGEAITWNPRIVAGGSRQGVEIYRQRETTLAVGERIQWGLNNKKLVMDDGQALANGMMLRVESFDGRTATLASDTSARIQLDMTTLATQHWDHAYATTVYKSQGRTEDRVLVNAEANQTELFNQKAFLVAISRHREKLSLYADSIERFTDNVEKELGDKTTAQASRNESRFEAARAYLGEFLDRLPSKPSQQPSQDPQNAPARDRGLLSR